MTLESDIKAIIARLNRKQASILSKNLAISFTLGFRSSGTKEPISKLQKNAIQKIAKENLGYITEFNESLGKMLETKIKEKMAEGGGYEAAKKAMIPFIEYTFKNGIVEIDNTGKQREVLEVDKQGNIYKVLKTIEKPYSSTIENYSNLLSRTVAHTAIEKGRAAGYQAQGITHWKFIGSDDERTRDTHRLLLNRVFEYGTIESDLAEEVLQEINCRHRAIPFFNNPELD